MRARVLGEVEYQSDRGAQAPPAGQVGELLQWLLLRPNEAHPPNRLIQVLWPGTPPDSDSGLTRLHVVVSRLRRLLGENARRGGRISLVTDDEGYRLDAGEEALDRVAFEILAERALAGDTAQVMPALALWKGDPYSGFPLSDELQRQRLQLFQLYRRLVELRDEQMPAWSLRDSFARTKFRRLEIGSSGILPRPRLLDRAGSTGEISVLAVTAPAGYGKSVLLSQWAEAQSGPVAWVTLETEDNDPVRFWAAVFQAFVTTDGLDLTAIPGDAAPGSPRFIRAMAEVLGGVDAPVALVMDDAHHVVNVDVHNQLRAYLAGIPDWFTVAVGSRLEPPFPLEEHVLEDRLRTLTAPDLQFAADETATVVRRRGVPIDAVDLADLFALTEGWPIAVSYLTRLGVDSLRSGRLPAGMDEYLADEVLDELPDAVRTFLLATAHLDELHGLLCDAVTGGDDGQRHLNWLRERDLFVSSADADTGWHRYHHLVANVLRRRAENDPHIDVVEGRRRAARWYRSHHLDEAALEHAIPGGDTDTVVAVAGDVIWTAALRGEIYTCRQWLQAIDPETLVANRRDHDVAMLVVAPWLDPKLSAEWVASRRRWADEGDDVMSLLVPSHQHQKQGRPDEAIAVNDRILSRIDAYFAAHPNRPGIPETITATLQMATLSSRIVNGTLHHDDEELAAAIDDIRGDNPLLSIWMLGELAFLAYVEGNLPMAAQLIEEIDGHLPSMDRMSIRLGAARASVTKALIESDRAQDSATQRRVVARLTPFAALYEDLGWRTDLIPVRLALHVASRRAGDPEEAAGHAAQADLLLSLCDNVPFLVEARQRFVKDSGELDPTGPDPLTERELTVLEFLGDGLTYVEIADKLDIGANTVRSHASAIYRKIGVRNRHEAARAWRGNED